MTENLQNETEGNDLEQIELAALEEGVASSEPKQQAAANDEGVVTVISLGDELSGTVELVVKMLGPVFPSLKAIYTSEVVEAVGHSVADVCNKYGWLQDGLMGEYQAEITCLMVCGPLALATHQGIKNDIAARQPKPQNPPPNPPGQKVAEQGEAANDSNIFPINQNQAA